MKKVKVQFKGPKYDIYDISTTALSDRYVRPAKCQRPPLFFKKIAYPILLPRAIFSIPGPLDVPMNGSAGSPNRNSERRAIDESTRQYAWGTGQMAYDGSAMAWYVRSALWWWKPEQ